MSREKLVETIQGHCEVCNVWATLYPVRETDPVCPDDTVVVALCERCLPEPRRD